GVYVLCLVSCLFVMFLFFFFSSRRRHTRWPRDWSSDVCSSDLDLVVAGRALGYQVEKLGPFTRVTAPAQFARNPVVLGTAFGLRSEERRVGKECRSRWGGYQYKKNIVERKSASIGDRYRLGIVY